MLPQLKGSCGVASTTHEKLTLCNSPNTPCAGSGHFGLDGFPRHLGKICRRWLKNGKKTKHGGGFTQPAACVGNRKRFEMCFC
mmetsp:Transcript_2486/g.5712  ORF Transcript_2486/g.5712 Transcript_2486/m.5712 type:complete len:83 (-) Transcript_2486:11-259(-)